MDSIQKIILGTVQFGLDYGINNKDGKPTDEEMFSILDCAYRSGIKILDTAEAYGDSQERIGDYHRQASCRFDVITKFHSDDHKCDIKLKVKEDLNKLGISYLYGYMFHSFADYQKYFKIFRKELLELISEGIIKKLGVSVYNNEELKVVMNEDVVKLVQLPFNLFDNEKKRGEILRELKNRNIEIHTRSSFLQGLFFKNPDDLSGNLLQLKESLVSLNRLADGNKLGINELALNYPLSKSYIDKVLIGVDSLKQLKENLKIIKDDNPFDVYDIIDNLNVQPDELLNPSKWNSK